MGVFVRNRWNEKQTLKSYSHSDGDQPGRERPKNIMASASCHHISYPPARTESLLIRYVLATDDYTTSRWGNAFHGSGKVDCTRTGLFCVLT